MNIRDEGQHKSEEAQKSKAATELMRRKPGRGYCYLYYARSEGAEQVYHTTL